MTELGIVGDIHGHPAALAELLQAVRGDVHHLVFLGDYVNRGVGSAQVLDELIALQTDVPCTFLEGNHDAAFRSALEGDFDGFLALGGAATVRSYVGPPYEDVEREFVAAVPSEHRAFLKALLPTWATEELVVAHRLPPPDGTGRFRVGGHAPQLDAVPGIGDSHAYVDTGCGTLDDGRLTCLMWPSLRYRSVGAT